MEEYENYYIRANSFENPNWKSEPAEEWGVVGGLGYQRSMETGLYSTVVQRKEVPQWAEGQKRFYDKVIQVCFTPKNSEEEAWKTLEERAYWENFN